MKVELLPHQEKAVSEMHDGCILAGDVGTGKTITVLAYALLKEAGKHIYVITTAKKRDTLDWEREAAKMAVPFDQLTVDSWNNIGKYVDVENSFFVFDEQRLVGTGAWVKSFYKIAAANRWVLLSATPGDTWMDYVPVFIANGFYKNVTEFRQQHVIYSRYSKFPKVERYLNPGLLQRRRNLVLVMMPMERHTTRHIEMLEVDYDQELFERVWKRRWHVYEERPLRDAGELFRVGRKVVGSDTSRLSAVRDLLKKHPKLIVFYNYDYELEMLRTLVPPDQLASTESIRDLKRKLDTSPLSGVLSTTTLSEESTGRERITRRTTSDPSRSTRSTSRTGSTSPSGTSTRIDDSRRSSMRPASSPSTMDLSSHTTAQRKTSSHLGKSLSSNSAQSMMISGSGSKSSLIETSMPKTGSEESLGTRPVTESTTTQTTSKSFAVAEWNGHKHEPIPETDSWVYLVQYTSGSEGWNCIETDAVVFYSLTYSYKQFYQSQGRIDRMNTSYTDLYYYVLVTKSIVDRAVWRALQAKKDFNLKGFKL